MRELIEMALDAPAEAVAECAEGAQGFASQGWTPERKFLLSWAKHTKQYDKCQKT